MIYKANKKFFGKSGTKNNKNVIKLEVDTVLTCFNIIVIFSCTEDKIRTGKIRLIMNTNN